MEIQLGGKVVNFVIPLYSNHSHFNWYKKLLNPPRKLRVVVQKSGTFLWPTEAYIVFVSI